MQLPPGAEPRTVRVELATQALAVYIGEERVFEGPLFAPVKAEESVWLISAFATRRPWRPARIAPWPNACEPAPSLPRSGRRA